VVSVTDFYGRIIRFLDRSRYFFFEVAPQLYSRGWVDPVPDPLLLRKSGNAGNGIPECRTEMYCFLWGTNWIYISYIEESRPLLWSSGHSSWLHNGDVLSFLWGTNWIYICYVEESRPPLWSCDQSSWLQYGDVLCFLWGTKLIYICYVEESWPPLWSSDQSSWLHNGDVLCFLWGTNWFYICSVEESRPPLWSSGHSSCLQIQRSGFDSRRYQIFWEVVGLVRGPLSLVSTTEQLLGRKSKGPGLGRREYGLRDPLRWPRDTPLSAKVGTIFADNQYSSIAGEGHRV
jgi:hypothetical protein